MLMEWINVPLVPLTVTVAGPVAAVPLTSSVRMLVVAVLTGLNVAVTPEGNPDADKLTLPENPLRSLIVIVLVALPPCGAVTLLGEAESEKSGAALTVRL